MKSLILFFIVSMVGLQHVSAGNDPGGCGGGCIGLGRMAYKKVTPRLYVNYYKANKPEKQVTRPNSSWSRIWS